MSSFLVSLHVCPFWIWVQRLAPWAFCFYISSVKALPQCGLGSSLHPCEPQKELGSAWTDCWNKVPVLLRLWVLIISFSNQFNLIIHRRTFIVQEEMSYQAFVKELVFVMWDIPRAKAKYLGWWLNLWGEAGWDIQSWWGLKSPWLTQ